MSDLAPFEIIARHYVTACLWAEKPEYKNPRASKQALQYARVTAQKFLTLLTAEQMTSIREAHAKGYGAHPDCGTDKPWWAAVGHDLYLTSAGHGAGFWDRKELGETMGDQLTALCGFHCPIAPPTVEFYRGWMYIN